MSAHAASIEPPSGALALQTVASGVQTYTCEFDQDHQLNWKFKAPSATLYDTSGKAVIRHGAGPTWTADDGSSLKGEVMAQMPSDDPEGVPQLLLQTKSSGAKGLLTDVQYVQRIKTRGGMKPATNCTVEHQVGNSPYIANYLFFK